MGSLLSTKSYPKDKTDFQLQCSGAHNSRLIESSAKKGLYKYKCNLGDSNYGFSFCDSICIETKEKFKDPEKIISELQNITITYLVNDFLPIHEHIDPSKFTFKEETRFSSIIQTQYDYNFSCDIRRDIDYFPYYNVEIFITFESQLESLLNVKFYITSGCLN